MAWKQRSQPARRDPATGAAADDSTEAISNEPTVTVAYLRRTTTPSWSFLRMTPSSVPPLWRWMVSAQTRAGAHRKASAAILFIDPSPTALIPWDLEQTACP